MRTLKGKRLLILGGSLWKEAIKQFADEHEIILIATGNDQSAGIFDIADEKYNVNSTDARAMKALIKEMKIDGVYMGGSEAVIGSACQYLEELGLPCYCTYKQWNTLQNKKNFKSLCIQSGLPVVPKFEFENGEIRLDKDDFPVITKPTDGCGSSGFSVCYNNDELQKGYRIAADESATGSVITEKFVKNDSNVVFYTVSEGKIYFSGLSDKYPVRYAKQGSYVGGLFVYESRFTKEFRDKFEEKIQKMITSINIKEGCFWIEVFHDGNEYYFNEVGYRYGGSASIFPTDYLYGINQVASDIYYALTGESLIIGHKSMISTSIKRKNYYAVYPVHLLPGTINSIEGVDILKTTSSVVTVLTTKNVGDTIIDTGSFSQAYALIHVVFDSVSELKAIINFIHDTLVIKDEDGNSMVNRMLEIDKTNIILN